jgi:hypothetical protein
MDTKDPNFEIKMKIMNSDDGWKPESIWVLGETLENQILVLGAHPKWEGKIFDSEPESLQEHVISSKGNIAPFP